MAKELKATVVNLKSLEQDIQDPIVIGGGDANGRSLRVIFTQEAAAQFSPHTKIYLSWKHKEKDIKGYNIFTEVKNEEDKDWPPTWEIHYPQAMLHEGNVLACIELVDEISIAASTNFIIHVLADPNDGSEYVLSDDYSDFKRMIISISNLEDEMREQMEAQEQEFAGMRDNFTEMQNEFTEIREDVNEAVDLATKASEKSLETYDVAQEAHEYATKAWDQVIASLTWIELNEL